MSDLAVQPINRDPFGDEKKAPVVPRSMSDQVKPDQNIPPAGHSRDEFMRQRRDALEEQIAQMPADMAGGRDVSEIPIENEIAQAFDGLGNLPISQCRNDRVYKWKKADDIQSAHAQNLGFKLIQGDPRTDPTADKEGVEHIGKHCAAGTTLRGRGDVLAWWIPRERYEAIEQFCRQKGIDMGQVTEKFEEYGAELAARGLTPKNLAHGNPNDPLIQRVFANGPAEGARMGRVLRDGSLPGARPNEIFSRR